MLPEETDGIFLDVVTRRFSSEAGGPLTPQELADQLRNPHSILNKALAGFVTHLSLIDEQVKQLIRVADRKMLIEAAVRREEKIIVSNPREEEEIGEEQEIQKGLEKKQEVFVQHSDAKFLYSLYEDLDKLKKGLEKEDEEQRKGYNGVIQAAMAREPANKEILAKFILTPETQKEFHETFKETVKNVAALGEKLKLTPEQQDQKVGVNAELKFMAKQLGDGEKNLKPSEVAKMFKLKRDTQPLFQSYLAAEKGIAKTTDRINDCTAKIKETTDKIAKDVVKSVVKNAALGAVAGPAAPAVALALTVAGSAKKKDDENTAKRLIPKLKPNLPGSKEK